MRSLIQDCEKTKYQVRFNPIIYTIKKSKWRKFIIYQMLFAEIYLSQLLKKSDQFEEKATLETPEI